MLFISKALLILAKHSSGKYKQQPQVAMRRVPWKSMRATLRTEIAYAASPRLGDSILQMQKWNSLEMGYRGTASGQIPIGESVAGPGSNRTEITNDLGFGEAELGCSHRFYLRGHCQRGVGAFVSLAAEPQAIRSSPAMVLASW